MKKTIALLTGEVEYTLQTSERARNLRLTIHQDGTIVVTAPVRLNQDYIDRFIQEKSAWVIKKLDRFKKDPKRIIVEGGRNGFARYKDQALLLAQERISHFNAFYQFRHNRITIRNQKSRWGSCSRKGNLNFNYKIALLPRQLADYIIVHELCHLVEFNHSPAFWSQVAKTIPDWQLLRKEVMRTVVR